MAIYDYFPFVPRPAPKFVTEKGLPVHGYLAQFETPAAIYQAAEKVRDQGYEAWDVFTPFPIHGLDEAMGQKRTILPIIVACGAFTGTFCAFLMQFWMSAYDYNMVKQGKPWGAWEPFMPIGFELSILFAAFTALIGMLALNGLPRWHHPLFRRESFLRVSQDGFAICIEAIDPKFHPQQTKELLQGIGATSVELVEDP
jgi:hypothetical protein